MGVIGGYEDLRGEGAVGAPVMDALREPTRCAAVVVCLVCVRVCIMRCDFERKSRVECADWRERAAQGGGGVSRGRHRRPQQPSMKVCYVCVCDCNGVGVAWR